MVVSAVGLETAGQIEAAQAMDCDKLQLLCLPERDRATRLYRMSRIDFAWAGCGTCRGIQLFWKYIAVTRCATYSCPRECTGRHLCCPSVCGCVWAVRCDHVCWALAAP
jgi:hypothetical protein